MAKIRKRTWKNKSGKHTCYEITYVINGKLYRKSGYKSEIDAQCDLPNVIAEISTNIKFNKLAELYLNRHCALNCKKSTKELYENYLKVNLDYLKNMPVKNIKKKDIEHIILNLKQKGLINKTINNIITFVQAVLNYGVDNDLLKENPIAKFKKLPQIKPPIHFLNEKQLEVFLELAKNNKFYVLFATAIYTGMRRGELLGLEWSDINFKTARITVNKQIYKGVKTSTKTNKERVIDIPQVLIDILQEYKQQNKVVSKLVFHNGTGQPVHPFNMEDRYFRPLIAQSNKVLDSDNQIEKLRFHDLRHTYATLLISNNVPVKFVQEQLGHSTARMTLDTYASVMPSVKFEALNLLNNIKKNDEIEHKLSTKN